MITEIGKFSSETQYCLYNINYSFFPSLDVSGHVLVRIISNIHMFVRNTKHHLKLLPWATITGFIRGKRFKNITKNRQVTMVSKWKTSYSWSVDVMPQEGEK